MIFVIKIRSVFCEARTIFFNVIQMNLMFPGIK
jgi:hypothetical protein